MKVPQPLSRTLRQGGDTAHCELWIGQGWREETRDGDSHQRPEHGAGDQQHHDGRNGPGDFSDKSTCGTSPKAGWDCTITVSFSDLVKIGTCDACWPCWAFMNCSRSFMKAGPILACEMAQRQLWPWSRQSCGDWLRRVFQAHHGPALAAARYIQRAIAGYSAQPELHVLWRFQLRQVLVQRQKHILRQFFGNRPVAQQVPGDTEDHGLMLPHQASEIQSGRRRWRPPGHFDCSHFSLISYAILLETFARVKPLLTMEIDMFRA